MRHRHPAQQLQGGVVLHLTGLVHPATVAVAGVLAQADIGDDTKLRGQALDLPDGLLHRPRLGPGLAADGVFLLRQTEQQHRGHAGGQYAVNLRPQLVHGEMVIAGHGGNLAADTTAGGDEQGEHEIIHSQVGLPDHTPDLLGAAQPRGSRLG